MNTKTAVSIITVTLVIIGFGFLTFWKPEQAGNDSLQTSGESITIAPTVIDVSEDSFLLGISGSYPQFSQASAAFNTTIANVFTGEIKNFKETVNADYTARLEMDGDSFAQSFAQDGSPYNFIIEPRIIQSNENFISVVIHFGGYTGGAHGFQNVITFNYDVRNNTVLDITRFKTLAEISDASRVGLKQQFQEKDAWSDDMQDWINDGTDPNKPENFQAFTFTNDAITVYFGQYQVAPYVYGESQVEIAR